MTLYGLPRVVERIFYWLFTLARVPEFATSDDDDPPVCWTSEFYASLITFVIVSLPKLVGTNLC